MECLYAAMYAPGGVYAHPEVPLVSSQSIEFFLISGESVCYATFGIGYFPDNILVLRILCAYLEIWMLSSDVLFSR